MAFAKISEQELGAVGVELLDDQPEMQPDAMKAKFEETAKQLGEPPHHIEGHRGGVWTLLDFSSVVVHVFMEEARQFYDLERLWADAVPVEMPGESEE